MFGSGSRSVISPCAQNFTSGSERTVISSCEKSEPGIMRYDVSDLVWSVIEPDGPFRERCPRYNTFPR